MKVKKVCQLVGFSSFFGGIGTSVVVWDWRPVVIGIVVLLIAIVVDVAFGEPVRRDGDR